MTEVQCMMLGEKGLEAIRRIEQEERPRLQKIAEITFAETLGRHPELYLDPRFGQDGITLQLLTELYRQAHEAGVVSEGDWTDASQVFEQLRPRIFDARRGIRWVWAPRGKGARRMLTRLRYLMACLEDTNRVRSLPLLIRESLANAISLDHLTTQVKEWRTQRFQDGPEARDRGPAFAYAFA